MGATWRTRWNDSDAGGRGLSPPLLYSNMLMCIVRVFIGAIQRRLQFYCCQSVISVSRVRRTTAENELDVDYGWRRKVHTVQSNYDYERRRSWFWNLSQELTHASVPCLFVRLHISKTTRPNFHKFSVHIERVRGSILLRRRIAYMPYISFQFCGCCHVLTK